MLLVDDGSFEVVPSGFDGLSPGLSLGILPTVTPVGFDADKSVDFLAMVGLAGELSDDFFSVVIPWC